MGRGVEEAEAVGGKRGQAMEYKRRKCNMKLHEI
jgi:hypothetical protein